MSLKTFAYNVEIALYDDKWIPGDTKKNRKLLLDALVKLEKENKFLGFDKRLTPSTYEEGNFRIEILVKVDDTKNFNLDSDKANKLLGDTLTKFERENNKFLGVADVEIMSEAKGV